MFIEMIELRAETGVSAADVSPVPASGRGQPTGETGNNRAAGNNALFYCAARPPGQITARSDASEYKASRRGDLTSSLCNT